MKAIIPRSAAAFVHTTLLCVFSVLPACAQSSIAYSGFLGQGLGGSDVDFDGDGTYELAFDLSPVNHIPGMSGEVYSVQTFPAVSIVIDGMLYGEELRPVSAGEQIGLSLPPESWSSRDLQLPLLFVLRPTSGSGDYQGSGPLAEAGGTAFLGFRLQMSDGAHYGWARLAVEQSAYPSALLLDWAYETSPEVSIAAGVVPEPSTLVLLIGGSILTVWFRRAENETNG